MSTLQCASKTMNKWRIARVVGFFLMSTVLAGALCDSPPAEEEEEEVAAAERLQQPRNVYDGNVNENLRGLRDDLEETARDRQEGQETRVREATAP